MKEGNSAWGLRDFQNFLVQKFLQQALACDQSTEGTNAPKLLVITKKRKCPRDSSREAFGLSGLPSLAAGPVSCQESNPETVQGGQQGKGMFLSSQANHSPENVGTAREDTSLQGLLNAFRITVLTTVDYCLPCPQSPWVERKEVIRHLGVSKM